MRPHLGIIWICALLILKPKNAFFMRGIISFAVRDYKRYELWHREQRRAWDGTRKSIPVPGLNFDFNPSPGTFHPKIPFSIIMTGFNQNFWVKIQPTLKFCVLFCSAESSGQIEKFFFWKLEIFFLKFFQKKSESVGTGFRYPKGTFILFFCHQ